MSLWTDLVNTITNPAPANTGASNTQPPPPTGGAQQPAKKNNTGWWIAAGVVVLALIVWGIYEATKKPVKKAA